MKVNSEKVEKKTEFQKMREVSGSQKPEPDSTLHANSRTRVILQAAQAIASTSSVTKAQGLRI